MLLKADLTLRHVDYNNNMFSRGGSTRGSESNGQATPNRSKNIIELGPLCYITVTTFIL